MSVEDVTACYEKLGYSVIVYQIADCDYDEIYRFYKMVRLGLPLLFVDKCCRSLSV